MIDLSADIGYKSINYFGEELCGDHVDIVKKDENSSVIVLADGLGSGVKASILSTLTSKIISTMMAAGLSIEECVATIAAALPVCSIRGVAYSTFTIIHLLNNETAEIIQYDNPHVIIIRNGEIYDYPKEKMNVGGKKIYKSTITLQDNDVLITFSDGCSHAGLGTKYSFGWERDSIARYMQELVTRGHASKNLATMLVNECKSLYDHKPGDDMTACVIKLRKREPVNLFFGPPVNYADENLILSRFFSNEGKYVVCGGTTSSIVAKYLGKPIKASLKFERNDIPPIAYIEGVDLVTEGVITMNKVLQYAKDYLGDNDLYEEWNFKKDGASLISRLLFEEATDINFYVGRAVNPAHQDFDLPINFNIKMNLVEDLSNCLIKMGKRIKVSYF